MTAEKTALNERQSEIKAKLMKEFVELRKSKKMTQQALADKTGIARPNIARMENGSYNPTVDMMVRMADGLGMTIEINWVEKQEK